MAVSETIQELLQGIDEAQYGRDMRQFIHKGIQKCYEEGSAGETDLTAREMAVEAQNDIADILTSIAPIEETTTTTQAYAVGDYLYYDGTLYKVTTAIASGGTISIGTNVSPVSVADTMKQAEVMNTSYVNNFSPSTKSGSQYGTATALGAGTFLIIAQARITSDSAFNATARCYLRADSETTALIEMTLVQSDWHFCETRIVTLTDTSAYVTPNIVFNSGSVMFANLTLNIVRLK